MANTPQILIGEGLFYRHIRADDAVILHHFFHGEVLIIRLIIHHDVLRAHIGFGRAFEHPPPHEHQESAGLQKYHGP